MNANFYYELTQWCKKNLGKKYATQRDLLYSLVLEYKTEILLKESLRWWEIFDNILQSMLSPRMYKVLKMRLLQRKTYAEMAKHYGLTRYRMRQIEESIINDLKTR